MGDARGTMVREDRRIDAHYGVAATCSVCDGALGGLRMIEGKFVHREADVCARYLDGRRRYARKRPSTVR